MSNTDYLDDPNFDPYDDVEEGEATTHWVQLQVNGVKVEGKDHAIELINKVIRARIEKTGALVEQFDPGTAEFIDFLYCNEDMVGPIFSAFTHPDINFVMEKAK
jgi:hypothetical protein